MEKRMRMNKIPRHRPHTARPARGQSRRWPWLAAAPLAACLTAACASAATGGAARTTAAATLNCGPQPPTPCYSPQEFEVAYGVAPLLRRGIDGRGQTVALLELAQTPSSHGGPSDIRKDLAAFDRRFGLPPARLTAVNTIAKSKTPYLAGGEELGDTEMVHAFAPGAALDIVLVPADAISSPADFAAAIAKGVRASAALHASVLSISGSGGEHFFTRAEVAEMHAALKQARDRHVTVATSSGDNGAISSNGGPPVQVNLPASDPLVLGAGGTILDATPAGRYLGEMAWNDNTGASGGGYSSLFRRPSYQRGLARARATRGVPDVSANADGSTGMATVNSYGQLRSDSGTSSSVPLWAGVIALADQLAGRHLGFVNPALYAIARGPAYHRAFHDVVTGDNSILWPTGVFVGYNAGPGWDPVTGLGSPNAQYLVPLLASKQSPILYARFAQDPGPRDGDRLRGGRNRGCQRGL
jgi:subtilase family serine protease